MYKKTILAAAVACLASNAFGYSIDGNTYCDVNGNDTYDAGVDTPLANVEVLIASDTNTAMSEITGVDGDYYSNLNNQFPSGQINTDWFLSLEPSTINGPVVLPPTGTHTVTLSDAVQTASNVNFLVDDPSCQPVVEPGLCWLTGGGVKFERQLTGDMPMAEHGPRDSFGGNVHPSCSSEPGNGGQWNHIAHSEKLHFQGTDMIVTDCGNVPGIEPGSESPVTGFNYIEFEGTGRLKGIKGNKLDIPVSFQARVEDRNEPGNENASAGENIDQYRLVVRNSAGVILLEISEDDPTDADDLITITGGNMQLHESSCDN